MFSAPPPYGGSEVCFVGYVPIFLPHTVPTAALGLPFTTQGQWTGQPVGERERLGKGVDGRAGGPEPDRGCLHEKRVEEHRRSHPLQQQGFGRSRDTGVQTEWAACGPTGMLDLSESRERPLSDTAGPTRASRAEEAAEEGAAEGTDTRAREDGQSNPAELQLQPAPAEDEALRRREIRGEANAEEEPLGRPKRAEEEPLGRPRLPQEEPLGRFGRGKEPLGWPKKAGDVAPVCQLPGEYHLQCSTGEGELPGSMQLVRGRRMLRSLSASLAAGPAPFRLYNKYKELEERAADGECGTSTSVAEEARARSQPGDSLGHGGGCGLLCRRSSPRSCGRTRSRIQEPEAFDLGSAAGSARTPSPWGESLEPVIAAPPRARPWPWRRCGGQRDDSRETASKLEVELPPVLSWPVESGPSERAETALCSNAHLRSLHSRPPDDTDQAAMLQQLRELESAMDAEASKMHRACDASEMNQMRLALQGLKSQVEAATPR